jgi:tRNA threonylcarbamoyl adenosine modification protein (Sua5/YciO/YrdC/YwlC family)
VTVRIVTVNPEDPPSERLDLALEVLRREQAVALPTETFYGLAVDCLSSAALRRVNAIKKKAADSPILLLMADADQAETVADPLPDAFRFLAERFWPGPLTLVVRARPEVPDEVSGGRGTVALRVPGLALPRMLAQRLGRPISGPSANRTGEPPCRTAAEVARAFPEGGGEGGESEIAMLLDGGPTAGGAPSTIVDLTQEEPCVLREGLLPLSALRRYL